ncbi:unnamed protein product [Rotaria sp. Silwood1]|nr:unnamed protein product [Rotaria sp. Silwood1]
MGNHNAYERVLIRTSKYGNKYMKDCPVLSIVLQILFEGIDDECLKETNVFDDLWFTLTNDGLSSITKYSEYISKNCMSQQLKSQSILFRALSEHYRENVFLSLKESKIVGDGNIYKLILDDITEHGWLTDVQSIKDDVAPRSCNMLLEKLRSFHKKAELPQREESKTTQGAQRTELVRPELASPENNNTNENDEPKSDQSDESDDSDDAASIFSDISFDASWISIEDQIFITGLPVNMPADKLFDAVKKVFSTSGDIKVQMGRARIRKTKQAVKGPQSSVTSKQIPREGNIYLQQKIGCECGFQEHSNASTFTPLICSICLEDY